MPLHSRTRRRGGLRSLLAAAGLAALLSAPAAAAPALPESFECKAGGRTTTHAQARFDAGAVTLAYAEGPDNGPPLVLIPGMSLRWQTYIPVAQRLCDRFHVFMLDMRGHGASDRAPDGSYRVQDFGGDVAAFLRGRVGEPTVVSGHSLGGLIALWVAANEPSLVAGLNAEDAPFLMSEAPRWHGHWIKPAFVELEQRLRTYKASGNSAAAAVASFAGHGIGLPRRDVPFEQRIRALGKVLETRPPLDLSDEERRRLHQGYRTYLEGGTPRNGDFLPRALMERVVESQLHLDPEIPAHAVSARLNEGFDHLDAFRRVRAPTLYWQADQDLVGHLGRDDIAMLVGVLQQNVRVRHVYMPGVGHQIHRDAADRFAAEIAAFFLKAD